MASKKMKKVLDEASERVKPTKEEISEIQENLKEIRKKILKSIKKKKTNVEFFIGGSYAKGTLVKKDKYDIDIFLRFDKKYSSEDISKLAEKILRDANLRFEIIHGSRDYFRIKIHETLSFEIVPVVKIDIYDEAENVTDLSYSHVEYINKKIKRKRVKNDVRLAKAFCYANDVYGAESYIKGFSGYSLELLVYNFQSFRMFLNEMIKVKPKKKEVIDIEYHHKGRKNILLDLKESKLQSPVILIDPTFKYRNVLAALSNETFRKFQIAAKRFLEKPSLSFFEKKDFDYDTFRKNAKKKKHEFQIINIETNKQPGDVAGSKLLKFYNHLSKEISEYFVIEESGFDYNKKQAAKCFFSVRKERRVLIKGPKLNDKKNVKRFQKKHKNTYKKSGRWMAKKILPKSLKDFVENWKKKHKARMKEMSITGLSFE